ncbi:type II secretion system F family protein [Paenibacillus massiliensis]|uniref:type II secretion system F family protein n=1 Tax=Paenibacillus massiliensis TaxID=225917 RepID=UPI00041A5ED0|nr:type II secretion system F family protein [Paenibacillus massiliensis]
MPNWMMYIYYFGLMFFTLGFLFPKAKVDKPFTLSKLLGYEKVRKEAEDAGWSLSSKEFISIIVFSIIVVALIAIFIGNYFFIALGIVLCFTLPRAIVLKVKRKIRQNVLFDLPANLRLFISKLADFPNIQKALENALPDMSGVTKPIFEQASNQLRVGFPLEKVLDDMMVELRIRKMEDFMEKLVLTQTEGFHARSLESLRETVEEISEDIQQIQELEIDAKRKRRDLFLISIMAWLMPILLSFLNTGDENVFLNTSFGQVYIVSFAAATLFSISKGDDFLSLNLDKL